MLLKERGDLILAQRAAKGSGAVVDFGAQVRFQLGGDIVALLFREPEPDGGK